VKGRKELYILTALLALVAYAAYYFFSSRDGSAVVPGVLASDTKFEPLRVREPGLRLDLLEKVRKLEYSGSHRNIFVVAPPPPPQPVNQVPGHTFVGPKVPPPPPPLQVPAEFFGYASEPRGVRVAFFTSGDDILVVGEGETFLGRFRLDRIHNDSADVEEIGTGRHANVQLVQPPDQGGNQ
jgi:hypothetical protein